MSDAWIGFLGSLLVAYLTYRGVIYSANKQSDRMAGELAKAQAVTDAKLEDLTREVREHNEFARRVPVMEEQIRVINNRIADLEKGA